MISYPIIVPSSVAELHGFWCPTVQWETAKLVEAGILEEPTGRFCIAGDADRI